MQEVERRSDLRRPTLCDPAIGADGDGFGPMFRQSMFWMPERQAASAWIEHVPFAFWLVDVQQPSTIVELGTHHGVSYSAMCQAVKSIGLPTRCFAIDTWKGDKHAGFYPEDVYVDFATFHNQRYGAFSRLVRSTFDEALRHFEDRSIDLLHIDGLHTYDAVRHDFESWLPKLSADAVVLVHDTNVRENNFGVFRLWSEVSKNRLHFNFLHGHGLGVLGLGNKYAGGLRFLFEAGNRSRTASIRQAFSSLGLLIRVISESELLIAANNRLSKEAEQVRQQLETVTQRSGQLELALTAAQSEKEHLHQELKEAQLRYERVDESMRKDATVIEELKTTVRAGEQSISKLETERAAAIARENELQLLIREVSERKEKLETEVGRSLTTIEFTQTLVRQREYATKRGNKRRVWRLLRRMRSDRNVIHKSGIFDPGWYVFSYPEAKDSEEPMQHFLEIGWLQGYDPSVLFSTSWYLDKYSDVQKARINPVIHYIHSGAKEGRDPHPLFSTSGYLLRNPDVRGSGINPLAHFIKHGGIEGRDPHPLFKSDWYLDQNPDVRKAKLNPLMHYILVGASEGRSPHPEFYSTGYREDETKNPLAHALAAELRKQSKAARKNEIVVNADHVAEVLGDEYGRRCSYRVLGYYEIVAELERAATAPARRSEVLAWHAAELRTLSSRNHSESVDISIIVPVCNHLEYSIGCLYSIMEHSTKYKYEVIVGNDASRDETKEFLESIGGIVRVITHEQNKGFVQNCNQCVREANGRYIVLLNNDTFVLEDWLNNLIEPFETLRMIGLVGSKLIMGDGRLQEAGGIVWRDGNAWNFGRNKDPRLPEFNYVKDVDYISAASIALRKETWDKAGGFDERYSPAYWEDCDLAFRLRKMGLRTLYQPFSAVIHHEGVSHGTNTAEGIKSHQVENANKFVSEWHDTLVADHHEDGREVFLARDRSGRRRHMLIVDHYIPQFDKDAGSRYLWEYIRLFVEAGLHVTLWPDNLYHDRMYAKVLQKLGVEVLYGPQLLGQFEKWASENGQYLDYAFLSRAHISMPYVEPLRKHSRAKILFCGHDIHFWRSQGEYKITGDAKLREEARYWRDVESAMWMASDVVFYPSGEECEFVRTAIPEKTVRLLPVCVYSEEQFIAGEKAIVERDSSAREILFVGGFRHGPNADGIRWFCQQCLPRICAELSGVRVHIVGSFPPAEVLSLAGSNVVVHGYISDQRLAELYLSSTISIAPLRFGAGVKGKVVEAFRYGIPVVSTATGMQGISGGKEFCEVADEPEQFAAAVIRLLKDPERRGCLARRGLEFVTRHYSRKAAIQALCQEIPEVRQLLDG